MIDERPTVVDEKSRVGDWEIDTIIGKHQKTDFYFAHPYSSWERGLNENTNGLVRQYIKKGAELVDVTDPYLDIIANKLNNRPGKTLGYKTPREVFHE